MGKIITGYGRSGTSYLSSLLSDISDFDVRHEPRGNRDELMVGRESYVTILDRDLSKKMYMEVNSYLRHWLPYLESKKYPIALLLRKPSDIYLSVCNRKPEETHQKHLKDIVKSCTYFFGTRLPKIKFEDINSDESIDSILEYFAMQRVKSGRGEYPKNKNRTEKYAQVDNLPKTSLSDIDKIYVLDEAYFNLKSDFK